MIAIPSESNSLPRQIVGYSVIQNDYILDLEDAIKRMIASMDNPDEHYAAGAEAVRLLQENATYRDDYAKWIVSTREGYKRWLKLKDEFPGRFFPRKIEQGADR